MKITKFYCDNCNKLKDQEQLIPIDDAELCKDCSIELHTNGITISCNGSLDSFGVQINLLKSYEALAYIE
jgi:hypothetical protein